MQDTDLYKEYPVSSVCRADLLRAGYSEEEVAKLDDSDMEEIASRLADAYCANGLWIALPIIVDGVIEEKVG